MAKVTPKTKDQFLESYEEKAGVYDKLRSKTLMGKMVDRIQLDFISKLIPKRENLMILDVGCGTGRVLIPLAKKVKAKYSGMDPAKNMLDIINQKKEGLNIELTIGDVENIPYEDNTFDFVYTTHVMMHLRTWDKAISEMFRVLKPGGTMIADFPNKNSPYTRLALALNPKKTTTYLFTKKQLRRLYKDYNFKISGIFSYSKYIYRIPILRNIFYIIEKIIKLPAGIRSQLFVIVRK